MDMLASSRNGSALTVDRRAALAVADELVGLTAALSDLAYDLGSNADTLRKHMNSLQSIDLITQIQLALAQFLRSDESLSARLSEVTVAALADRLSEKTREPSCRVASS